MKNNTMDIIMSQSDRRELIIKAYKRGFRTGLLVMIAIIVVIVSVIIIM
jgi:hypothetical protein